MAIPVKLEVFEGPLDLLLHLIDKNKVDIYDIPIVEITEQYLDYIRQMETEDMNVVSEFLVMAATLIDIKCKMLLPKEVADYRQPVDYEELIGDMTLQKLHEIFKQVMKRQEDKIDPVRSTFGNIEKDEIDMDLKTTYVEAYVRSHKTFSFRRLLEKQSSKMEVIVTFLVILEMIKTGRIGIEQEDIFADIIITTKDVSSSEPLQLTSVG